VVRSTHFGIKQAYRMQLSVSVRKGKIWREFISILIVFFAMSESPEVRADLRETLPGPGHSRFFSLPTSCRKAGIFAAISSEVMPQVRGFSLILWHGNTT